MSSLGNTDLLERHLVAFFASRSVTPETESRVIAWAEDICKTDSVVISGFHSPLEKEILNYLLERQHPVIIALGRALYKRIPEHLQPHFDEGRVLFVSFRDYSRHSWNSAHIRNWSVAKLAEEVYFTQFDNTSSLSTLHYTFKHYGNTPVHILE